MKTYSIKTSDIQRQWHVLDASGKVLGKLATQAATLLMGKHKPIFTPNLDTGDFVVIINAEKVSFSGGKEEKKLYYRHSGYPGGLKNVSLEEMMQADPTRVIEHAVKGMLPTNRLRAVRMKKLKVYVGEAHPHLAQTGTSEKGDSSG
jgi:large subunit ribosomal protein L13